jgi:hypothetical protein
MVKKARAKTKAKSKPKSKSRPKTKSNKSKTKTKRVKVKKRKAGAVVPKPTLESQPRAAVAAPALVAPGPLDPIIQIATAAPIMRFVWPGRGKAPPGYIKGMALVYGRVYCELKAGNAAATAMAKQNSGNAAPDALAWYAPEFAAAGMNNSADGADTLRHLFVLMIGLGMRESSGKYCTGRDTTAPNTTADTAEAGLFQASFNASAASPLMPALFNQYSANPSGFLDVFKEGATCSAADAQNFGTGPGEQYQALCKSCPAFAAEFAAVGLRFIRTHWGPINRKEAQLRPECDAMLQAVQNAVDASAALCGALQ